MGPEKEPVLTTTLHKREEPTFHHTPHTTTQPHKREPDTFQCHKRAVEVTTTPHRREPATFQPHTTTPHKREPATSQPHKKEPDMLHTVARPTVRRLTLQATEREVTPQLHLMERRLTHQLQP